MTRQPQCQPQLKSRVDKITESKFYYNKRYCSLWELMTCNWYQKPQATRIFLIISPLLKPIGRRRDLMIFSNKMHVVYTICTGMWHLEIKKILLKCRCFFISFSITLCFKEIDCFTLFYFKIGSE